MLIIFDKDGTLVRATKGPVPNKLEDQHYIPGVLEKCVQLREQGHLLAVASNQGGVAFGYLSYQDADLLMRTVAEDIGAVSYRFSPYHVKGKIAPYVEDHQTRKPNPGMLLEIMKELNYTPENTLYVGDRPEDQEAAKGAGVQFQWAKDFFGRDE